jgi:ABC-type Mn2+/Zn2+ transport system permease subunit
MRIGDGVSLLPLLLLGVAHFVGATLSSLFPDKDDPFQSDSSLGSQLGFMLAVALLLAFALVAFVLLMLMDVGRCDVEGDEFIAFIMSSTLSDGAIQLSKFGSFVP